VRIVETDILFIKLFFGWIQVLEYVYKYNHHLVLEKTLLRDKMSNNGIESISLSLLNAVEKRFQIL